jgi:uncharacterized membrane protein
VLRLSPTTILTLGIIIALAAMLRLYHLDFQSFWDDEIASLAYAAPQDVWRFWNDAGPPGEDTVPAGFWGVIEASQWEPNPPLYWLGLHYWLALGTGAFTVRLFSALLGVLFVPGMYLCARELFGPRVALGTALFAALSPFHIWYSQEARPYALMMTLSVAASLMFWHILRRHTWRHYAAYAVVTGLGVLTFSYMVFVVLSHTLCLVLQWKKYRGLLKRWAVVLTIVALCFLPVMAYKLYVFAYHYGPEAPTGIHAGLGRFLNQHIGTPKEINLLAIAYTLFTFSVGFSVGPSVHEFHISRDLAQLWPYVPQLAPLLLVFFWLFLMGLVSLFKEKDKFWFVSSSFFIPIISAFVIAKYTNITYNVRYVGMSIPMYFIIISSGIFFFKNSWMRYISIAIVIIGSLYALNNYYFVEKYAKEDVRSVLTYIRKNTGANDLVFVLSSFSPYRYYASADRTVPRISETQRFHYYQGEKVVFFPLSRGQVAAFSRPGALADAMTRLLQGYSRVWVVANPRYHIDPEGRLRQYLASHYTFVAGQRFANTLVTLYALRANPEDGS